MKKEIGKKIIIIMVGLIFVSTQFIYPLTTSAEIKLNWENPNQGKSPYKFKLSDYLNSQMAMQVVGCTGIVNKVSGTLANLMSGDVSDLKWIWEGKKEKIREKACVSSRIAMMTALSVFPNTDPETVAQKAAEFCHTQKVSIKELEKGMKDELKVAKGNQFREECLNGIAYTLARNQLATMTKQTMNWVTSGFNGDPMYARNINNFLSSVEDEITYQVLNNIKNTDGSYNTRDYPYGKDFERSYVKSRQSAQNFAESSKQDLTNYLTGGATIEEFAGDFSKGGWAGWLALTQHENNNPLGYTKNVAQEIANKQAKEIENVKEELNRNDGFLDQKKCVAFGATKKSAQKNSDQQQAETYLARAKEASTNGLMKTTNICKEKGDESLDCIKSKSETDKLIQKYNEYLKGAQKNYDTTTAGDADCTEWETVTPGSLIKDKVSTYLNSPERQLEIADNINEVLSVLFAELINKLRLDGLSSLNSETFNNNSGGIGSNSWTTPLRYTDVAGNKYTGSGLDENRAFDLTKDLGNIYNRADVKQLGTWDAKTNTTYSMDGKKGLPLIQGRGEMNTYYEVAVAGDTKLFEDGDSGWEIGDRAFFDGKNWQNWKKGTNSPITKRGIIQIQQDYIVVAKELLKVMPAVMPALGELDYCIPGPNPNWQINSSITSEIFTEFVEGLEVDVQDRANIVSPTEKKESSLFKNYQEIFESPEWPKSWTYWSMILNTDVVNFMDALAQSLYQGSENWVQGLSTESDAHREVGELKQGIFDSLAVFNKEYPIVMNKIYGTIQQEYKTHEDRIIDTKKDKNESYIPMSKDGLTMTKKMISYDEEIKKSNADLKETINETDSVINKLELIKGQVGQIIKAAQDRRDKTITEALNKDYGRNYGTDFKAYKKDYAVCLDEENIDYLEYTQIKLNESDRCGDKIDNDFDGLIDEQDKDCTSEQERERARTSGGNGGTGNTGTTGNSGSPYENYSQSIKDYSQEANAY